MLELGVLVMMVLSLFVQHGQLAWVYEPKAPMLLKYLLLLLTRGHCLTLCRVQHLLLLCHLLHLMHLVHLLDVMGRSLLLVSSWIVVAHVDLFPVSA